MAELSPAAQVMIAVTHVYQEHGGDPPARTITAAALRAAADQILPSTSDWYESFMLLANELEAQ